jgi:hypothetical protein
MDDGFGSRNYRSCYNTYGCRFCPAARLRDKRRLLLLDSFEQFVDAAPLVSDLLAAYPLLTILVTSRESLKVGVEREFPITPLALPDRAGTRTLEVLGRSAAVHLFTERAQAIVPSFDRRQPRSRIRRNNVYARCSYLRRSINCARSAPGSDARRLRHAPAGR